MNHRMNLKIALTTALLLGQSLAFALPQYLQSTKLGTRIVPMDNQTPVPTQPTRIAKGTVQIDRYETTWDASNNRINNKITPICKASLDVHVYDIRNAGPDESYYFNPPSTICPDKIGNTSVNIIAGSIIYLVDTLSIGLPPSKLFSTFAYPSTAPGEKLPDSFPSIRDQNSFSTDLNQVHFGAISFANSGMVCKNQAPSSDLRSNDAPPPNCEIISPVSYQAIWTAEDRP